jgi:hypothetical protein
LKNSTIWLFTALYWLAGNCLYLECYSFYVREPLVLL